MAESSPNGRLHSQYSMRLQSSTFSPSSPLLRHLPSAYPTTTPAAASASLPSSSFSSSTSRRRRISPPPPISGPRFKAAHSSTSTSSLTSPASLSSSPAARFTSEVLSPSFSSSSSSSSLPLPSTSLSISSAATATVASSSPHHRFRRRSLFRSSSTPIVSSSASASTSSRSTSSGDRFIPVRHLGVDLPTSYRLLAQASQAYQHHHRQQVQQRPTASPTAAQQRDRLRDHRDARRPVDPAAFASEAEAQDVTMPAHETILSDAGYGFDVTPLQWTADMRIAPQWHSVGSETRQGAGRTSLSAGRRTTAATTAAATTAGTATRTVNPSSPHQRHQHQHCQQDGREEDPALHSTLYAHVLRSELLGEAQLERLGGVHITSARSFHSPSRSRLSLATPTISPATTTATATTTLTDSSLIRVQPHTAVAATTPSATVTTAMASETPANGTLIRPGGLLTQPRLHESSTLGRCTRQLLRSRVPAVRRIPQVPFRILDAPGIVDDFYLNVMDWSSQNLLAVGLADHLYTWNALTSQADHLFVLPSTCGPHVSAVKYSDHGSTLAIGTSSGSVQLWDVETQRCVRTYTGHRSRCGVLSWNGPVLSTGSRDRSILHRDTRDSHEYTAKLSSHRQEVCGLRWSPDRQLLASGGNDNVLFVWDQRRTDALCKFTGHSAAIKALAWSPHQRGLLASGGGTADRHIRFWNVHTNSTLEAVDTGSQVCNLLWSANVDEILSTHGYSQNQIAVWNHTAGMSPVATLTGHSTRVLYLAVSPDGESVVTGAGDESLRFWHVFPSHSTRAQTRRRRFASIHSNRTSIR